MGTETAGRSGDRPSTAADGVPLEQYDAVTTREGELLVYDADEEEAWIQADRYCSRADLA